MFKKLRILAIAILLLVWIASVAHALYGYEKYWSAIYDTEGNVKTDITSVTIYDAGTTTVATVYSDDKGTSLTNPMTTGISDGTFEFWTAASSVDVIVSDGVRSKKISGMTTTSPHRILLTQQIGEKKVLRFLPEDFRIFDWENGASGGASLLAIDETTIPAIQLQNRLSSLVWQDGEESYVQVTFKVPTDYSSGGAFKAFVDYSSGSDNPEIGYFVYVNSDGTAWDASYTAQTPVDPAGTAGTPELVNLPIATDFASLAADQIVTFAICRGNQESSIANLELYYVEFYYNAKE